MGRGFKIFLVIFLSIIAVALSGILAILIIRSPKTGFVISLGESYSQELVEEKTFEELKDLNINIREADVYVKKGSDNEINVKLYSDNPEEYKIKNEKEIEIILKDKKKTFNLFKKSPRVVVTVPSSYENDIIVNGTVGDVKVEKFPYANLYVDKSVGDVKADSINKADIKITVGDIKITKVNEIKAKSSTGDIKLGTVNEYLNIDSTTGDIKIEKVNISKTSKINNNVGDIKIERTNAIYIDGKTNVGDVKINTNHRKSDVELIISNNIGDIKVG